MKNLEQIRAHSALTFANQVAAGKTSARGKEDGEAVKKIPPMIMGNGLLATLAFSLEPGREGFASIFSALAAHLASKEIDVIENNGTAEGLVEGLVQSDSATLKLATAEALEWLGYARRFVKSSPVNQK